MSFNHLGGSDLKNGTTESIHRRAHLCGRDMAEPYLGFAQTPKRFLVVCFNRSLVPFLRDHFYASYRELTHRDPSPGVDFHHLNGLPYAHSRRHGGPLEYRAFQANRNRELALDYCAQLDRLATTDLQRLASIQYDAIYVDEGQDLFEEEFVLLLKFLKTDPNTGLKNIVIFYDDAQNLYGRPRPTWNRLGIEVTGRTRVMKKCFRNTKQIVEFAFNLLLGAKSEIRVRTRGFADIETLKEGGLVRELPDRWEVNFAERLGELPKVALFGSREEEKAWVERTVLELITEQAVRPRDILLVADMPQEFESVASALLDRCNEIQRVIKPFGKGDNSERDRFIFEDGCLTLATVQAAKGYDSPVVFLMGIDSFDQTTEGRAQFYVGATRAKMRLYVTGLKGRGGLAEEAEGISKLLETSVPASETPLSVPIDLRKVPASPRPSKVPIPARDIRPEVQLISRPAASPPIVLQAFTPQFRRGAAVHHPRHGAGKVVQDGVRKYLSSSNRWDEDVRVQFGGTIKKLEAGSEGLTLVQSGKNQ